MHFCYCFKGDGWCWSDYLAIFSRSTILRGRYWIYQQVAENLSIIEKRGPDTKFLGTKSTSKIILSVEDYSRKFWRQSIIIRYFFWVKWLGIFTFKRCIYSGKTWQLIHYGFYGSRFGGSIFDEGSKLVKI